MSYIATINQSGFYPSVYSLGWIHAYRQVYESGSLRQTVTVNRISNKPRSSILHPPVWRLHSSNNNTREKPKGFPFIPQLRHINLFH